MYSKKLLSILSCLVLVASYLGAMEMDREALLELLQVLEVPHDGKMEGIVAATQHRWLQKGKERWEFEERYLDKREAAFPFLERLGCVESVFPAKNAYTYAIVLGGYASRVKARLDFLETLKKNGLRYERLLFFTGERYLDPSENMGDLKTETEMMLSLYPDPVIVIDTPQQRGADGVLRRPNTADTVRAWLNTNPLPGTCLVITNQPFVPYQDEVLRTELPAEFPFETVGPKAEEETLFALYLDTIARWLYQKEKP